MVFALMLLYLFIGHHSSRELSYWIDSWVGIVVFIAIGFGVHATFNSPWIIGLYILCVIQTMWYASNITGSIFSRYVHEVVSPKWVPQPATRIQPYTLEQEIINLRVKNQFSNEPDPTYNITPISIQKEGPIFDLLPEK